MAWEHEKSRTTLALDILRHLLVLAATCYAVFLIWQWNWVVALIAAIPVYFLTLNLAGFLTLPFYYFTPENKLKAKAYRALMDGDYEQGEALTDEFIDKFNVNVPKDSSPSESMTDQEANDIIDAFSVAWQKAGKIRDARLLPESKQRLYEAFGQEITRFEERKKIDPVSFREEGFDETLELLKVGMLAIPEFQTIDPEDEAVIAQINSGQTKIDRTNIKIVTKYGRRHTAEVSKLIGRQIDPTNPVDLEGLESSDPSDEIVG